MRLYVIAALVTTIGCSKRSEPREQPTTPAQAPAGSSATRDPWAGRDPSAEPPPSDPNETLVSARSTFHTKVVADEEQPQPPDPPPASIQLVKYDAAPGKLAAYLTPDPKDSAKHPAIIWITGGDSNSIGDVWSPADPRDDQTARQYREAGVVTMYPSLRGGNNNPGQREGFYGEVDDVLAAADFLSKQPYVDPSRIYLGGHSTGGTLVLLVAAAAPKDKFRAVLSFGPVHDVASYDGAFSPFDTSNRREFELRSPARWINTVSTPTFVFEGTERGNLGAVLIIKRRSKNPLVKFFAAEGRTHFDILAPANKFLASQIVGPWTSGPPDIDSAAFDKAVARK
jgi:acetyl esterase/lipase